MKPQGNGIVELHDSKQSERGFNCMKLIQHLTEAGVTDWEEWHNAHWLASVGRCPFTERCPTFARTAKQPHQLSLF